MNRSKLSAVLLIAISVTLMLTGCGIRWFAKKSPPATTRGLFAVTAEKTGFYRYGPQQGHGPDQELPRDTLVTMIRHSFGYSKVRLAGGEQGFVANDDLTRAPERLIAQVNNDPGEDLSSLPPTPEVKLPIADPNPAFEPTPIPQELELMPQ